MDELIIVGQEDDDGVGDDGEETAMHRAAGALA